MACMLTAFGTVLTGSFCLLKKSEAPGGECPGAAPYFATEAGWLSVEGAAQTVCKPALTTCQGQNDFRSKSCSGVTEAGDAECGAPDVNDAYCAPFGAMHYCTVPCVSYLDCKNTRPADEMECQQQILSSGEVYACQFE